MEVGPLARMLVAYAAGHPRVKALVDGALKTLGVGPEALFSTLGRVAARGIETQVLAEKMEDWVDGARRQHAAPATSASTTTRSGIHRRWPADATGAGFHEAPRGALGHWVHIKDGLIANYQMRRPEHLERRAARRERAPRTVRRGADRHAGRRSEAAASRSCAPFTRSIRAWRAACTSSTRTARS